LLLGIPVYWNTVLSVLIVSYAVVMYAQNPVKSPTPANVTDPGSSKKTVAFQTQVKFQKENDDNV
jgi:hypothetical protein